MNSLRASGPVRAAFFSVLVAICLVAVAFAAGPQTHLLYSFPGAPRAAGPTSTPIADAAGNLYGTTADGGKGRCIWSGGLQDGCGTIFELSPKSGGGWTETLLYSFEGGTDGAAPYAGLVMDTAGNLYGATTYAGINGLNPGTIFELSPPAESGGAWTFTLIYNFPAAADGATPYGTLIFDKAGNLYGTTAGGGPSNFGTVFELSPPTAPGGTWTEEVLLNFSGSNGSEPFAGLYMDGSGNLYGTTVYGGYYGSGAACEYSGCGVVFELSPGSGGTWTEAVLHEFHFLNDGRYPFGGLAFHNGNLYGTSSSTSGDNGGAVFQLAQKKGGAWTFSVIHSFDTYGDGYAPYSGPTADAAGNIYGTTSGGGPLTDAAGIVYELSPPAGSGDPWAETILSSFSTRTGSDPIGGLLLKNSKLYGTTTDCQGKFTEGCSNSGAVFEITSF